MKVVEEKFAESAVKQLYGDAAVKLRQAASGKVACKRDIDCTIDIMTAKLEVTTPDTELKHKLASAMKTESLGI